MNVLVFCFLILIRFIVTGAILKPVHQLCYAHALHLAVLDVMYKANIEVDVLVTDELQELVAEETEENYYDFDDVNAEDAEYFDEFIDIIRDEPHYFLYEISNTHHIKDLVMKVRKVVKLFRKSPTKNDDILQKRVMEQHHKNLVLILDSKTRWNSTVDMLRRFHHLEKSIRLALIDIGSEIYFEPTEWELISTICKTLSPIECAVKKLCSSNTNLIIADLVLSLLFDSIPTNNPFGEKILEAVVRRINERRTLSAIVLFYLHFKKTKTLHYAMKTIDTVHSNQLLKFLMEFCERSQPGPEVLGSEQAGEDAVIVELSEEQDFDELLNSTLATEYEVVLKPDRVDNNELALKKELDRFTTDGTRGPLLKFCYESLLGIQCTSTESERAFSVAGRIVNKFSTRLGDESILELSMLKGHFSIL